MTGEGILATCPGKLGDILYSLPAVMSLAERSGRPVHYQTAAFSRSVSRLLAAQPYIGGVLIDETYRLEHTRFGCQPWRMAEPAGFDRVYHLGFRPAWQGAEVMTRHLTETFYAILNREYGLGLTPTPDRRCLAVDDDEVGRCLERHGLKKPFVVFQGYGETLMDHLTPEEVSRLNDFWKEMAGRLDAEVVCVSGRSEAGFYDTFGWRTIVPEDLFEAACLIQEANGFMGVQSAAAAIANGLKTPRLIHDWFRNASPNGPGGMSFNLPVDAGAAAEVVAERFGLKPVRKSDRG